MAGIQLKFSVPQFPEFRYRLDAGDEGRYRVYMRDFMSYASNVMIVQSRVAQECISEGGFKAQKDEIEKMISDVRSSIEALGEKSAVCVGEEIQGFSHTVLRAVADVGNAVGALTKSGVGEQPEPCGQPDVVPHGKNWERNRGWKAAKKEKKARKREQFGSSELKRTLEAKWQVQNEYDTRVLRAKLDSLTQEPKVAPVVAETEEEQSVRSERARAEAMKIRKQREKMEQEMAAGVVEKEVAARIALLDGQLSGKYSLTAPQHVVGYAQTLNTATSSSVGSSGAGKTVWSGSGATKVSRVSSQTSREAELERKVKDVELEKTKLEREVKTMKGEMAVLRQELEEERSDGGRREFFSRPDDVFLYGSREYKK